MRFLTTLTLLSLTMSSLAMAAPCCKPAGCSPDRDCVQGCKPVVKKVDITTTCYNIETKTICIPPTRFPWDPSLCDGVAGCSCGTDCSCTGKCGTNGACSSAGTCRTAGRCGAGCGNSCESGGLLSGLRAALGMSNCPTSRRIKTPNKSTKKVGEKCVWEWVTCGNDVCGGRGGGCKPACAAPKVAPPASAPVAPPQEAAPAVAPAPPKSAQFGNVFPRR